MKYYYITGDNLSVLNETIDKKDKKYNHRKFGLGVFDTRKEAIEHVKKIRALLAEVLK